VSSSVTRKGPSLKTFAKKLHTLPRTTAIKVAEQGSGKISNSAQSSFDGGMTAHNDTRPLGTSGNTVTLVKGGKLRAALRFLHDGGTKIRAALGEKYMGVMTGRFRVLPNRGEALPDDWQRQLSETTDDVIKEEMAP
jgi:hypothetical protein